MQMYNVDEVFDLLKSYKITTHKESVRRWLRQGEIKGIAPASRKEGWLVSQAALDEFIQQRLPESYTTNVVKADAEQSNTTFVAKEIENNIRTAMWLELAQKNIWEGHVELKKTRIFECTEHRKYSKELANKVWQRCLENSKAYSKPRVFYLLEAFAFEGERLLLDKDFEQLEEQVIFAIVEYVRTSNVG